MRLKLFVAVLALFVLAGPSLAEDACPLLRTFRKLPVTEIRAIPDEHYNWVMFQNMSWTDQWSNPPVQFMVDVRVSAEAVRIKVNRDLGGNSLDVLIWGCDYYQGHISKMVGDDAILYVTSNSEKSRWKGWLRNYKKDQKKRRQAALSQKLK